MTLKTQILQISSAWRYYVNWQNTQIPFLHIHFSGKIKLILYPRVRNSITQLTILDICCIAFCRLTFREFLTDTQWKKVTPRNLHEMQRRNKQWNMKMGQIIDEVDFFKVQIFWEGHKNLKKMYQFYLTFLSKCKKSWEIFFFKFSVLRISELY